jgi:hypothetical protein
MLETFLTSDIYLKSNLSDLLAANDSFTISIHTIRENFNINCNIGSNLNTTNSTYLTAMSQYAQSEVSSEAPSNASSGRALPITWKDNQYFLQKDMREYISGLINRCAYAMSTENPPYYPYHAHLLCVPHGPRSSSTLFNLVSLTFTIAGLTYPQLRSTRQPQRKQKALYFQNLGPKICY